METVAHQAPLSLGFPRQEYWTGLPFPSPREPLNPRIEPESPALAVDSLPLSHQGSPKQINKCATAIPVNAQSSGMLLCPCREIRLQHPELNGQVFIQGVTQKV